MRYDDACRWLREGRCVAYPTETCWGLGVRADSPQAVEGLRALKGRALREPFSVLIPTSESLASLGLLVTDAHRALIRAFWPGPLTLLFDVSPDSGFKHLASPLLGVRCSSHPVAQALVNAAGFPITSTSANRHGTPVAPSAEAIRAIFPPDMVFVLDEPDRDLDAVSTVLALEGETLRILREGVISRAECQQVLEG